MIILSAKFSKFLIQKVATTAMSYMPSMSKANKSGAEGASMCVSAASGRGGGLMVSHIHHKYHFQSTSLMSFEIVL